MSFPVPFQAPLPGGIELLVVLLVFVVLFGVPLVLLVGAYLLWDRRGDDRVASLEARIDELEDGLDDEDNG